MTEAGFILTAESFDNGRKCEIRVYGTGPEGPFQLIFTPHKPLFFIDHSCMDKYTSNMERRELDLKNFKGDPVDALYFNSINSYFNGKRRLQEMNIRLYESDIRAEDRFLMERFIHGSLAFEGVPQKKNRLRIFTNPKIKAAEYRPDLSRLSLDIETGTDGSIYSIAFHYTGGNKETKYVLMRGDTEPTNEDWISYCKDEKALIKDFIKNIAEYDPDIIIGWHVIGFDLAFIKRRAEFHNIPLKIGRGFRVLKINEKRSGLFSAEIEGRLVVDGPQTLRTAFYKFENYKLETVAQELLGRGKDIAPDTDKVAEIERRFKEDKQALAFYNLEDAILVTEIFEKTAIIDQLVTRSLITGLPVDKVHMSVAAFDHFMLPQFHRKKIVAPDTADIIPGAHAAGGHVFTSAPGLYPHVVVLDFKSLYPTIMRTFFIDPYSRMKSEIDTVRTPAGIAFSKSEHILPHFLEILMEKRAHAKNAGDEYLAQAVKILLNSFYGVMGTTGCRFYHPDLPTAITGTGQWILKTCTAHLRSLGYQVIYGDTDSVFVSLKDGECNQPSAAGVNLANEVNSFFTRKLLEEWNVESELELEFEKHYPKFFLPPMRNSIEGARKRYAGLQENGEIEFKGLETVRSDWTELAKNFQKELFRRFFSEEDLVEWIKDFVEDLKKGRYDDQIIYKKRIKRGKDKYVKTSPPHIKAARKLDPEGKMDLNEVSYIMTASGPTPVGMDGGAVDYQHYIDKQIKPIADGVLFANGDDFDSIIEGRQLDLF
jgi:DNA polymerase-2